MCGAMSPGGMWKRLFFGPFYRGTVEGTRTGIFCVFLKKLCVLVGCVSVLRKARGRRKQV